MRLMGMFIAAIVLSTNASAYLEVTANGTQIYDGTEFINSGNIDFENVCTDATFGATSRTIDVVVTNNSASELTDFTLSLSGNSNEVCLGGTCPTTEDIPCYTTLPAGGDCQFAITLEPDHFGKKKKKLTIDAVDSVGNDVSLTIPVIGTSNNVASAQDIPCYQLPPTSP